MSGQVSGAVRLGFPETYQWWCTGIGLFGTLGFLLLVAPAMPQIRGYSAVMAFIMFVVVLSGGTILAQDDDQERVATL